MNRKITALIAGVLTLGLLAGADDCKGGDGVGTQPGHDPQPDKRKTVEATGECKPMVDPAVPPNLQKKRYITVWTCLEEEYGPYTVYYHASDGMTGKTLASTEEQVIGNRPFNRIIGYDSGQKVTLTVDLRPARAGSKNGYIIARDGPANTQSMVIDGAWTAKVQINAAR